MKGIYTLIALLVLAGCGGKSKDKDSAVVIKTPCDLSHNTAVFEDKDFSVGYIGGEIAFTLPDDCSVSRVEASWVDAKGKTVSDDVLSVSISGATPEPNILIIPAATPVASDDATLQLTANNGEQQGEPFFVSVIDLAHVSGPGGNYYLNWVYGEDRPALTVQVRKEGSDYYCIFDSGKVLVHDANFEEDPNDASGSTVVADDMLYPAYEFDCTDSQVNEHRKVMSYVDDLVHTYSMINDSMFYGSLVFDMYEGFLGVRPMDKIRMRVHYGNKSSFNLWAHWDGAYVNFNDVMFQAYGSASLDTVSHEITHGILQQHTALKFSADAPYHMDGRMLHEAFSDMASVMAHYYLYGELNWIAGDENYSNKKRYLNKIETENGAISSYFDYTDASSNYYKRMGMMTYPFYLLTQKWGVNDAFSLFLESAKSCWEPASEILHAARCVHQTARVKGYTEDDVIEAFRAVKIQLREEDTLAHYEFDAKKLRVQFTDDTRSDRVVTHYHWDFDDGTTSTEASPYHEYAVAGEYNPTLTVTDHLDRTDTFSRDVSITDQYCKPMTSTIRRQFDSVSINGVDLGFDASRYDYTDLPPIDVTADAPFSVVVVGTVVDTKSTDTRWSVRVDLNDDASYTEADDELLLEKNQANNEYSFNETITIDSSYIGKTVYMRLNGDTFKSFSACNTIMGSVVEVRLNVVAP
ncbi:MAG: vibriolysin [Oceanicoccus sp.]|jgi:vibriolysin